MCVWVCVYVCENLLYFINMIITICDCVIKFLDFFVLFCFFVDFRTIMISSMQLLLCDFVIKFFVLCFC